MTVILSLLVSSGLPCVKDCSVDLPSVVPTTPRVMGLLKDIIDHLSKCCVVIAVLSNISGLMFCHSVSLH